MIFKLIILNSDTSIIAMGMIYSKG
uniref:Uncharacterized protein n=1 Tax=Anguilla anguilla TaxID=7936 RepID=A0A0E9TCJ8_ANGAN